jgi:PAS domain S-box-containing protein
MVAFVRAPSAQWAAQNIETAMRTFAIDFAWVCRPDGSLVYGGARDPQQRLDRLPVPPATLPFLFGREHFPRFFVATDAGLLEVYGATVHPTRDAARRTPAAGYLFVARRWDPPYLVRLSELLQARATLITATGSTPPRSHVDEDGQIELVLPLPTYDGRDAAWLDLDASSPFIRQSHAASRTFFYGLCAGSLLALLLVVLALRRWVNRPLARLGRSLEEESPAPLEALGDAQHEFGQMARLIARFFEQKAELLREVEEHGRVRRALEKSEATFTQIFDNAPIGLLALDERLRITHFNAAVQKLSGYLRRELHQEHFSLLVHPQDLDHCLQAYREMREGHRLFHRAEVRYLTKAGEIVSGRQTDVAIRGPRGEFQFLVSMIEDLGLSTGWTEPAGVRDGHHGRTPQPAADQP